MVMPGWGGLVLFAGFGLIALIGILGIRSVVKQNQESSRANVRAQQFRDAMQAPDELEEEIKAIQLQEDLNPFLVLSQIQVGFGRLSGGLECMRAASLVVTAMTTLVRTRELRVATREQVLAVLDAALGVLRAVRMDDPVATDKALTLFSGSIHALKKIPAVGLTTG